MKLPKLVATRPWRHPALIVTNEELPSPQLPEQSLDWATTVKFDRQFASAESKPNSGPFHAPRATQKVYNGFQWS